MLIGLFLLQRTLITLDFTSYIELKNDVLVGKYSCWGKRLRLLVYFSYQKDNTFQQTITCLKLTKVKVVKTPERRQLT